MTISLMLLSACTRGTLTGTVTDALSGEPAVGLRVIAKAPQATDLTCMALEATTDATGHFAIQNVCANDTYDLSSGDSMWVLQGATTIEGGAAEATPLAYDAWMTPEGSSVYFLVDGELQMQKTVSDVSSATIHRSDPPQPVRFPETKLKTWTQLPAGAYLVITGANMDQLKLHPVLESPEVRFSPDREGITHWSLGKEWDYIGIQMDEKGKFELKTIEADGSMVKEVTTAERSGRFIPTEALPAGRYALLKDKARRTYMFEVGGAAPVEEAEAGSPE